MKHKPVLVRPGGALLALVVGLLLSPPGAWAQGESNPLPDLVITDLSLEPAFPQPNQITTVNVEVQNVGGGSAGFFRVVLRVNGRLTGSKTVAGLEPRAKTSLAFSWVARAGRQVLRVEANAFNDVEESNPDNDVLERVVEFTPDLVIDSVRLEPAQPRPDSDAQIVVTVKNAGGQPTKVRAALRAQDGRQVLATLFLDELSAGQSTELQVRWRPSLGEHLLRFRVDTFKRVTESDELNNLFTRTVDVSTVPPTGANLVVSGIALAPEKPLPGESATLSATVLNAGTGPAAAFELAFEVDGLSLSTVQVSELAPGEERTVSTPWTARAGERLIRAKADVGGLVVEPDEEDNVHAWYAEVGEPLNGCGQLISLELEPQAAQQLSDVFGLSEEEINDKFMPQVKLDMEKDFETVNLRLTLQRPRGIHSRLRFVAEDRRNILGLAPLDPNNRSKSNTGTVFIGSFVTLGRLSSRSLSAVAQAIANTASHEAGHFLGLSHDDEETTRRFRSRNMMAPSNESGTFFEDAFFTPENLDYLRSILPLSCER